MRIVAMFALALILALALGMGLGMALGGILTLLPR
jgi:hypothetical protein